MTIQNRLFMGIWLMALSLTPPLTAETPLSSWRYGGALNWPAGEEPYVKLTVTTEMYDLARPGLSDVRLATGDGKVIPYVLYWPQKTFQRRSFEPRLLQGHYNTQGDLLVTADFERPTEKNLIDIETDGYIFRRSVMVEGSFDDVAYYPLIKNAYIFSQADSEGTHRYSSVSLPKNDFRYLRLTIRPMPDEAQPLRIRSVAVWRTETEAAPQQTVPLTCLRQQQNPEEQISETLFDLPAAGLTLTDLLFEIPGESFYRYVTLYGRDMAETTVAIPSEDGHSRSRTVEVPWRRLTSGTFYRYRDDAELRESLRLDLPSSPLPRHLRLVISNYDDEPLTVKAAQGRMIAHVLVFPRPEAVEGRLYVGNPQANAPRYDVQRILNNPQKTLGAEASLGTLTVNPLWQPSVAPQIPWSEQHPMLLGILLGAVSLLLIVIIFHSIRTMGRHHPQPPQPSSEG